MDWGLAKVLGRDLNLATEGGTRIYMRPKSMWEEEQERLAAAAHAETLVASQHDPALAETMRTPGAAGAPARRVVSQLPTGEGTRGSPDESPIQPWTPPTAADEAGSGSTPTLQGSIMGTPAYMAPEQARGEVERLDQRADVYALGAILFEMLAGGPLRAGASAREVLKAACAGARPDFEALTRTRRIEPELRDICLRALEPEPANRYAKVPDLVADVKAYLDGERRWKLAYAADFSKLPDSDEPPADWSVHNGKWVIRGGALAQLTPATNAVIHLNLPIPGDVRVELEGWVEPGQDGELSVFLAAPETPVRKDRADGYCVQFGAEHGEVAKLARDGIDVYLSSVCPLEKGRTYQVQAELADGVLALKVDGAAVFERRDLFPLSGLRAGIYMWGEGARIRSFRVYHAGVAKERPAIAHPDGLAARGHWTDALDEYRRVAESHPGSRQADEARFKAGTCLVRLNRLTEAAACFEELKDSPAAALAWAGLSAVAEARQAGPDEEAGLLVQALAACPSVREEGFEDLVLRAQSRAMVMQTHFDFEASTRVLEALAGHAALAPALRARALREIGQNYNRPGSFATAREYYRQAIQTTPDDLVLVQRSLEPFFTSQEHQALKTEALSAYAEFSARYPNRFSPSSVLRILARRKETATAEGIFQTYVRSGPTDPSVYRECVSVMAVMYMADSRWTEATALLEDALRRDSRYGQWLKLVYLLGTCYLQAGRKDKTRALLERGRGKNPQDTYCVMLEAAILESEGMVRAAEELLSKASIKPTLGRWEAGLGCLGWLGHILLKSGRWGEWASLCGQNAAQDPPKFLQRGTYCQLWLALLEHQGTRLAQDRLAAVLSSMRKRVRPTSVLVSCHYMAMALSGEPGRWLKDEMGVEITTREALLRACVDFRPSFQDMLDYRATFDPAWQPWASNPNPVEKK